MIRCAAVMPERSNRRVSVPLFPASRLVVILDKLLAIWLIGNMTVATALRALANDRRLQILEWLKDPKAHFRAQVDGDLVEDGVCGVLIAEKLGGSQPTVSEHLKVLSQAGLLRSKRIKQWTFYKRDESSISKVKRSIIGKI